MLLHGEGRQFETVIPYHLTVDNHFRLVYNILMNDNITKWLSTILFLSAGTLVSLNIEASRFAFPLFLGGHVLLTYFFFKLRDWSLITQNGFFIFIDLVGIYRWFF